MKAIEIFVENWSVDLSSPQTTFSKDLFSIGTDHSGRCKKSTLMLPLNFTHVLEAYHDIKDLTIFTTLYFLHNLLMDPIS
jgi:hypothetical protein